MNINVIYIMNYWDSYGKNYQVKDIPDQVNEIYYNFWVINKNFELVSNDSYIDINKKFLKDGILPYDKLTDLNITCGNIGQFKKLINIKKLKKKKFNISLVIKLNVNLLESQSCEKLVNNIINTLDKYKIFTGIIFDYPINNIGNFLHFIKNIKKKSIYEISLSFNCQIILNNLVKNFINIIDKFLILTHNFPQVKNITTFHSNPKKSKYNIGYSCDELTDYYLEYIPNFKIYISGVLYSQGYSNTDGIGKYGNIGSSDVGIIEKGKIEYKLLPLNGSIEFLDKESKSAYSYDIIKKVINTYDNTESILEKCNIIYNKKLGGIVMHDISSDKNINHPKSLINLLN